VREAWEAFEDHPGERYRWRSTASGGTLIAPDASELASIVKGGWRHRLVKIGDRHAYDMDPTDLFRRTARVTDSETRDLVLTITGRHYNHRADTQLLFEDGRVVNFPVYAGFQRKTGVSRRWLRRFGVMFAIDCSGTRFIARSGPLSRRATLVLCDEPSPELLLLAVVGAPLIRQYFAVPN
jgi:hypothetical protein